MNTYYWFYIDTYVHISVKKDKILFYNTYTGQVLTYCGEAEILKLVKRLKTANNLRVIRLEKDDLQNPLIRNFVMDIRARFMGDLIDSTFSGAKPVQMPPYSMVRNEVKPVENGMPDQVSVMEFLSRLALYINNTCPQNCAVCSGAYRQFSCCTALKNGKKTAELAIGKIKDLFQQVKSSPLVEVAILGGNVLDYSRLDQLTVLLAPLEVKKYVYIHYLNLALQAGRLGLLAGMNASLKIPVTFPVDEEKMEKALEACRRRRVEADFIFIIRSADDFKDAEALISSLNIATPVFQPYYDGSNLEMFEENVYYNENDISAARPTFKEISARGFINSLNFGSLTVTAQGQIFAGVNASCLGVLGRDSLDSVIYKELSLGKSWKKLRKHVRPCKSCTYERLCPPISNYSTAIGKPNLCHIG